MEMLGLGL